MEKIAKLGVVLMLLHLTAGCEKSQEDVQFQD